MKGVIKVLNLVLAVILVGVMIVIWFGFNPSGLSASTYVHRQQEMIRLLNTPMPVLGAVTILLALAGAYLRRSNLATAILLAAALLFVGSGVITRLCNQPINAVVMTWDANVPPGNWESLRDQWWRWHIVRTVLAIVALILLFFGYRTKVGPAHNG